MYASHILLGRPWQYDRHVIHDGFKNRYSFQKDGRYVTLVPMTAKKVFEYQNKQRGNQREIISNEKEESVSGEKNKKNESKNIKKVSEE